MRSILVGISLAPILAISASSTNPPDTFTSLAQQTVAQQLGWVVDSKNFCGGFYLQEPVVYSFTPENDKSVAITTGGGVLSQRSTSLLEGKVTVTRSGQQITANRAYLYRDPKTGKLSAIDMIGNVHLRDSHSLIIGKKGRYNFETTAKSLIDITYRTTINPDVARITRPARKKNKNTSTNLNAWGRAYEFAQTKPNVYELYRSSYTTCPPYNPTWQVRAGHIVLDKNTGRGYATNARLLIKNVPVFYIPYFNFPIDKQRKSGFLWPTIGTSNKWGPYVLTPFYWNMAPNYDMTITPGFLSKRGVQLSDEFRYLTTTSEGVINASILPNDRAFRDFQEEAATNPKYTNPVKHPSPLQTPSITEAELNRLLDYNDTRKSFLWRDNSKYNEHWSSHVDFNYAGDDYFLRDFGQTLNTISANQLLQEGDLYYKGRNWNFTGRLQAYQTLHPINEPPVLNQYRRLPQLILNADYPDQAFGLEYFVASEATHFTFLNTPGAIDDLPVGNRLHVQPGISLPLYWSSFYLNPRIQFALTDYNLSQTQETHTPNSKHRALPILDIATGLALERNVRFLGGEYQQTLEPQVYYVYIPYTNQRKIPVFDTTVNTLSYDQIFNYNRFTGIDRIGDANQIGWGVTTRLIDQNSGFEKLRLSIGNIIYFSNRRVTLCNNQSCTDNPSNRSNDYSLSPITSMLKYHINPDWSFNANVIWNPITKYLDNTTLAFQYQPDDKRLINLGYTYARNGDIFSGISTNTGANNLSVTDVSAAWPLFSTFSAVGRWSQNWNHDHLQNLLYGLQYDTCCWAVRLIGGKAFIGFDTTKNNAPMYNKSIFVEFSLKGLGDIGTGNPSGLLKGIPGYKTQFG